MTGLPPRQLTAQERYEIMGLLAEVEARKVHLVVPQRMYDDLQFNGVPTDWVKVQELMPRGEDIAICGFDEAARLGGMATYHFRPPVMEMVPVKPAYTGRGRPPLPVHRRGRHKRGGKR